SNSLPVWLRSKNRSFLPRNEASSTRISLSTEGGTTISSSMRSRGESLGCALLRLRGKELRRFFSVGVLGESDSTRVSGDGGSSSMFGLDFFAASGGRGAETAIAIVSKKGTASSAAYFQVQGRRSSTSAAASTWRTARPQ